MYHFGLIHHQAQATVGHIENHVLSISMFLCRSKNFSSLAL